MADSGPVVGEVPFTAEERYRTRVILKAFDGMSYDEMLEVRRVAQTGKMARTVLIVVGRVIAYMGAAAGALVAYRSLK